MIPTKIITGVTHIIEIIPFLKTYLHFLIVGDPASTPTLESKWVGTFDQDFSTT